MEEYQKTNNDNMIYFPGYIFQYSPVKIFLKNKNKNAV